MPCLQHDRAALTLPSEAQVGRSLVLAGLVLWALLYSQLEPFSRRSGRRRWQCPRNQAARGRGVLRLRHAEGAAAARAGRVRDGRRAQLLLAGAHAPPAGRPARGRRQCAGRVTRHRHAVLLLLGRAAVHRLRLRGRAARRHLLLPDRRADGERGGARPAAWPGRLAGGAGLSRRSALALRSSPAGSSVACGWSIGWRHGCAKLRTAPADMQADSPHAAASGSMRGWTRSATSSAGYGTG